MRKTLVGFLVLAGAAGAAHAAPAPADGYLETGVGAGMDQALVGTLTLEAGHRIDRHLWAHAMFEVGTAMGVDEPGDGGHYRAVRLGVEGRACALGGVACVVAGLDGGARHVDYMAEYDSADTTGPVIVPRIGLDLGTRHLRVRPGIEKNLLATPNLVNGLVLTGAIAYQW